MWSLTKCSCLTGVRALGETLSHGVREGRKGLSTLLGPTSPTHVEVVGHEYNCALSVWRMRSSQHCSC